MFVYRLEQLFNFLLVHALPQAPSHILDVFLVYVSLILPIVFPIYFL